MLSQPAMGEPEQHATAPRLGLSALRPYNHLSKTQPEPKTPMQPGDFLSQCGDPTPPGLSARSSSQSFQREGSQEARGEDTRSTGICAASARRGAQLIPGPGGQACPPRGRAPGSWPCASSFPWSQELATCTHLIAPGAGAGRSLQLHTSSLVTQLHLHLLPLHLDDVRLRPDLLRSLFQLARSCQRKGNPQ